MKHFGLCFVSVLLCGMCAFDTHAEFRTGTDDEGNFYFPQRMAEWCSLNFDSDITEKVMADCLAKIAGDYHAAKDEEARKARIKFRKMKMESAINAFITAHEAKKKFANDKEEDKVEQINTDDADSVRTLASGNSEINKKIMDQENWISMLRMSLSEMDAMNTLENHGEAFVKKDDNKQ